MTDAIALPTRLKLMGGGDNIMDRLALQRRFGANQPHGRAARPSCHRQCRYIRFFAGCADCLPNGRECRECRQRLLSRIHTPRERPLDELHGSFQALHDRGLEMPTSEESNSIEFLRTLLPCCHEVLPPLRCKSAERIWSAICADGCAREKINLLKYAGSARTKRTRSVGKPSGPDLTLATPEFSDMDVDENRILGADGPSGCSAPPVSVLARTRRRLPKLTLLRGFPGCCG